MDTDLDYHFSLKEIRNTAEPIPTTAKPLKINWKQFKKLATEYYNDPFKNMKPNSAGIYAKIRYVDDKGNIGTELSAMDRRCTTNNKSAQ